MNGNDAFYFYFAQAAFWSGAAVAVIIGLLLEGDIDRLIIGFLAGLTFSYIIELFRRRKRTPWMRLYWLSEVPT